VRPVLLVSVLTFLVTSLAFPVATTWGTFLHAAGPAHVLLVLSCLGALDAGIARLGAWRGWTKPVAWLGAALGVFGSALFCLVFIPAYGLDSKATERQYAELDRRLAELGQPLAAGGPVITNFPIWLAEATGAQALALPAETPDDVVDLAGTFGARRLIVIGEDHAEWPAILDTDPTGSRCFRELDLGAGSDDTDPLHDVRAFEVVCP
jgi:hypothetical protein